MELNSYKCVSTFHISSRKRNSYTLFLIRIFFSDPISTKTTRGDTIRRFHRPNLVRHSTCRWNLYIKASRRYLENLQNEKKETKRKKKKEKKKKKKISFSLISISVCNPRRPRGPHCKL